MCIISECFIFPFQKDCEFFRILNFGDIASLKILKIFRSHLSFLTFFHIQCKYLKFITTKHLVFLEKLNHREAYDPLNVELIHFVKHLLAIMHIMPTKVFLFCNENLFLVYIDRNILNNDWKEQLINQCDYKSFSIVTNNYL